MKSYYIYKITDKVTKEFYIGSRGFDGDPLKDSYMGSPYVWKPNKKNLIKEILIKGIINQLDILELERAYILDNIQNPLNRNYSIPHNKLRRDNLITAKCLITGKVLSIFKNDPLFGTQFVGITKGKVLVKDSTGNRFMTTINDPKYISGELKHYNHGELKGQLHPNINKIAINNGVKQSFVTKDTKIPKGWKKGVLSKPPSQKSSVWIHHKLTKVNKRVPQNELKTFLKKGFELGRINLKKYGSKK